MSGVFFYFHFIFNVASDLGLHCLPRSQKRDFRLIWVNKNFALLKLLENMLVKQYAPNHMLAIKDNVGI